MKIRTFLAIVFFLCTGCGTTLSETPPPEPTPIVQTEAPQAAPSPAPTPTPTPTPAPTPEPTPLPLAGHIICLDPGHCVTPEAGKGHRELMSPLSTQTKPVYTTGTQGAGLSEEKLNLIVGLKLRDALEALGAEVVMTREVSEITITGIERCEIANESGADVHIHIHADGFSDSSVHGVSVLVPTGDYLGTPSIKDESVRLGELMVNAVAEATGAKNRGTIGRYDLTGLNFSQIPSVFIEMGYMTNPEEDARLNTEEYQDQIVQGMVNSLLAWYGAE